MHLNQVVQMLSAIDLSLTCICPQKLAQNKAQQARPHNTQLTSLHGHWLFFYICVFHTYTPTWKIYKTRSGGKCHSEDKF